MKFHMTTNLIQNGHINENDCTDASISLVKIIWSNKFHDVKIFISTILHIKFIRIRACLLKFEPNMGTMHFPDSAPVKTAFRIDRGTLQGYLAPKKLASP